MSPPGLTPPHGSVSISEPTTRRRRGAEQPAVQGQQGAAHTHLDQHVADVHVAGLRRRMQRGPLALVLHLEVGVNSVNCEKTGFAAYFGAGTNPRQQAVAAGQQHLVWWRPAGREPHGVLYVSRGEAVRSLLSTPILSLCPCLTRAPVTATGEH